ncbi:hypothetical protein [Vibrio genomosp. F6]|uniref:hypothetical protein n=1 Tax=Vibrio genomosp. F6 TaxID=723172 RepID=UPI001483B1C9|nr:hypothetical protein [Vibrio genomosp. F6]
MIKVYIQRHSPNMIDLYFPTLDEFYTCKGEWDVKPAIEDFLEGAEYELIEGSPSN